MKQQIPNFVTGLRILLTPLIAFVVWQPQEPFSAGLGLFLFIIASVSDWLDGYLARQMDIVSPAGAVTTNCIAMCLITQTLQIMHHLITLGQGEAFLAAYVELFTSRISVWTF